jgi:Fe-Mn family superoxide dismutase
MPHTLPKLPYAYDALEPFIDAKTMEIHHTKHHQTYVDKLNAALEKHVALSGKPVDALLNDLDKVPEDIRTAVRNHGGGHWNHSFFWPLLKKGVEPKGKAFDAIVAHWGSLDKFKEEFTASATGLFGSGWVWLVVDGKKLKIMTTPNQDTPISKGHVPILGLDCWEHGYYVLHLWNRAAYVKNWWNVVNWEQVEKNYKSA